MGQQRELRRAAAEAFVESLEQLQQTLESDGQASRPPQTAINTPAKSNTQPDKIDLDSLEAAIADIEQFIEQNQQHE